MTWRCKSELLGHISREISKYTLKPSPRQRDQVAKELISLFPKLKSNIGQGHHGWSQKIYDKMNEEAKRWAGPLKQRNNPTNKVKVVRLPRRGEINFTLDENVPAEKISASKQFLAEQSRMLVTERDSEAIAEHLDITFSHRRSLVSVNTLVKDIILDYPMFFTEQALFHDFNFINGFDIESRFLERLTICAQSIIEEGFQQRKKSKCIAEIVQNQQNLNATALRLLPFLLKDKDSSFFLSNLSFGNGCQHCKDVWSKNSICVSTCGY